MENKHIQNNRNENNKENDTTKKIGKIHIQENEYIKKYCLYIYDIIITETGEMTYEAFRKNIWKL